MNHWFGEQLRERTGDCDITFKDVRKSLALLLYPYVSFDAKDYNISDSNIAITKILYQHFFNLPYIYPCLSFTQCIAH